MMNRDNRMFRTYKERKDAIHESLYYSKGYWCNRSVSLFRRINHKRVRKLYNAIRNLEW